jgi:Rrf2 family protein
MKISTKGRYGVRFMLDLALHARDGFVTLKDISRRQEISQKYLWQIVAQLKSAGLVEAYKGSRGGFALARSPSDVTLKDILEPLEGGCELVDCIKHPTSCDRTAACVTRTIWKELGQKLADAMAGITLKDLVEKSQLQAQGQAVSYSI